jgi:TRAF-type zinc finger
MMASVEAVIEICENERAWIGGGFTTKGLLPNDRGRYSTVDGSLSFHTIDEATVSLLTRGWSVVLPHSTFEVCSDWQYARDFSRSAIANCQPVRSKAFHWVRFRRLSCPVQRAAQFFDPQLTTVVSECDHADSVAVHELSATLVDVLTYLTIVQSPNAIYLDDAMALPVKKRILSVINITDALKRLSSASSRLKSLDKALEELAISERSMAKYLLSKVGFYANRTSEPIWSTRRGQVVERYWTERDELAGWIVRGLDPEYELHCGVPSCGANCEYAWKPCPNLGCSVLISQKHLPQHDEICQYKVILCECGTSVPKHHLQHHEAVECALRDTSCPFAEIGCTRIMQARQTPQHLTEAADAHLLLAMQRILEIQGVVRQLNSKLITVEEENARMKHELDLVGKRSSSDRKELDRKIGDVAKKVSSLETTSQKEFRNMRKREQERSKA